MNLIKTSAAAWTREMQAEAIRNGYRVEFSAEHGQLVAKFFNGEFLCYQREWRP